jgi:DNA mismatch repair protein MSH5
LPYETEVRPAHEFGYESALNKLTSVSCLSGHEHASEFLVPGECATFDEELQPEDLGLTKRRGKLFQISSWLDLNNAISIGCAGAIIGYLQKKRSVGHLPHDPGAASVLSVARFEMFNLGGTMYDRT